MVLEDLRLIHEDNERLEQAIADRLLEESRAIRERLAKEHQIASFINRIHSQSQRALDIYRDESKEFLKEVQEIRTGDTGFELFNRRLDDIKSFHKRYPNQPTENLERAYKRRAVGEDVPFPAEIDSMFSGEEAYGRYFDLQAQHTEYVNLPGLKRRPNYLQYLDTFDDFSDYPRTDKMKEAYFSYLNGLASYLEGFMKRVKPLENLDKLFESFDKEFEEAWTKDEIEGWKPVTENGGDGSGPATQGDGSGLWCADCEKEFASENVFKAHLTGKKHLRAVEMKQARTESAGSNGTNGTNQINSGLQRLKERAVAERETRIKKLAKAMQTERSDTKVDVDRRQGITLKERAAELEALYSNAGQGAGGNEEEEEDEEVSKGNPLHLPLAWDGKPIPFWLYKLHGLGHELPCEICGNYNYRGRRNFEKHFSEQRHTFNLKRLGITNSSLFREITQIAEAEALWAKIQNTKKAESNRDKDVVQMEDSQGNVMPEKVYVDLQKAGLL